jgi:hypothetical protein
MISRTSRQVSVCLLAIVLLVAAGGCGESTTLRVENNWPAPLFPPVPPLIIDGIFAMDANITVPLQIVTATYNYLGPVDTIAPRDYREIYLVPGGYNIYVSAPDPEFLNCTRIYSLENVDLLSTVELTFAINATTEFFSYGDGCPTEQE